MPQRYPIRIKTSVRHLQPSIHWAQKHIRKYKEHYTRRIYDFELLYILEGTLHVEIDNKSYLAKAGELVYLQAGVAHTVEVTSQPSAVMLGIHYDYFNELEIQQDNDIIVDEKSVRSGKFCKEPILKHNQFIFSRIVYVPHPHVIQLMRTVIDEFTERRDHFELHCIGAMLQIISLLTRGHHLSTHINELKYKEQILSLVTQITNKCHLDWSNDSIADALNLEVSYAAKQFKRTIGMTPDKFIQYTRIQTAKTYLRETDRKIGEISQSVGYDNFHYFSRLFKKIEGLSPLQYRKLSKIF